jgi:hypothetical protein
MLHPDRPIRDPQTQFLSRSIKSYSPDCESTVRMDPCWNQLQSVDLHRSFCILQPRCFFYLRTARALKRKNRVCERQEGLASYARVRVEVRLDLHRFQGASNGGS